MVAQSESKPTFDSVRKLITEWRAEHKAPIPFPAAVWEQAVQLARESGVGPTARALKLDYGCLKKRSGSEAPAKPSPKESPLFFELFQSKAPSIDNCVLLLDTQRGCKVRLEFGPTEPAALAAFVRELG